MARLLVRGLRARRHAGRVPGPRTARAVADREDVGVARGLQRLVHDELVLAVAFEAVEVAQEIGRLDARGPHRELGGTRAPALRDDRVGAHFGHALAGEHFDAAASAAGPARRARRARAAPARMRGPASTIVMPDVALGVDLLEAVGDELARGLVQLGGELDAGRAARR